MWSMFITLWLTLSEMVSRRSNRPNLPSGLTSTRRPGF